MLELRAKDCLPFDPQDYEAIKEFIALHKHGVQSFFTDRINTEEPIAYFDNQNCLWTSGRYIGESVFLCKGEQCKVVIEPRFGNPFLFHLLEEVFNIRISESMLKSDTSRTDLFIKRIIAFIWLQKLAKANQYGFPRISVKRKNVASVLRGKLSVRKSIIPIKCSGEMVSFKYEKQYDPTILSILSEAYRILKRDYFLGHLNFPDNVTDILNHLDGLSNTEHRRITEHDYKCIRYRDIYQKFRGIVDFSWLIIRSKAKMPDAAHSDNGHSFFIDMAELWELYVRSLLKKHFTPLGWHVSADELDIYSGTYYKRKLVPDIVMRNRSSCVVFDAKYKRMSFVPRDFDRSDFFQIHTYAGALGKQENIRIAGLLYPLTSIIAAEEIGKLTHNGFYFPDDSGKKFVCEGIYIGDNVKANADLHEAERDFCNRIENLISSIS